MGLPRWRLLGSWAYVKSADFTMMSHSDTGTVTSPGLYHHITPSQVKRCWQMGHLVSAVG